MTPLSTTGAAWMITFLVFMLPVSFTFITRMPSETDDNEIRIVARTMHLSKNRNDARFAPNLHEFVLKGRADSGITIQDQHTVASSSSLPP